MTMKQHVISQYKAIFDELMLPQGFKRHTVGYYRVVNDVVHVVLLFYMGIITNVLLSIEPLAFPHPTLGMDRRGTLEVTDLQKRSMWTIWGLGEDYETSRKSVTSGLLELRELTREYAFPLLEKIDSCRTAVPVLRQLEQEHRVHFKTEIFWMCLKNHDFEQALAAINCYTRFDLDGLEERAKRVSSNPDKRAAFYKARYEWGMARNEKLDIIAEHLRQHDAAFVDEIIAFNEKRAIDYYQHPSKGFKRCQPAPWDFY